MKSLQQFSIGIIILLYLFVGTLYAVYTPRWQAPDEPAHYNYVRQLAAGDFPVIEDGDYDQAYLETVLSSRFDPQYDVESIEYEDWQPPLYYLLQTPIFWLFGGSLTAMRLLSILLGAGAIYLAYATVLKLFPQRWWVAATTAVFIAFLPQHLTMLASVNNDSLAELLIAAILFVLVQLLEITDWRTENASRRLILLGVLLGLGFLTKAFVYLMAPVIALVLLWRYRARFSDIWRPGILVFAPAMLLGLIWWVRNVIVYDGFDVMATAAHDSVVVGQPRTAEWVTQFGLGGTLQRFLQTTFNSFWGQFGWMAVPMPQWVYRPLLLLTGLVIIGLLVYWFTRSPHLSTPSAPLHPISNAPRLLLLPTFLLTLGLYLGYNLTFVQHQGRYLFPALIPIGVGVALGLSVWIRPFVKRWSILAYLLPLGLGLALFGLDLFALFRFIIPNLS